MTDPARIVGLDPGVSTGFAVWRPEDKRFTTVETLLIHEAMAKVDQLAAAFGPARLLVVFEDARKRGWFGDADKRQERAGAGIREGVGSVKRDCGIWEDFLLARGIPAAAMPPRAGNTKRPAAEFERMTKWQGRTSEHARDAALLVFELAPASITRNLLKAP